MVVSENEIIRLFNVFNELEILEIRINVLNDYVDTFVLVESTHTHSGKSKKLFIYESKSRFDVSKIIHIIVDNKKQDTNARANENNQINHIID